MKISKIKIIKRDGRKVVFDSCKIDNAIIAASVANKIKLTKLQIKKITNLVIKKIIESNLSAIKVETIQDWVIDSLNKCGFKTLAKKYSIYREQRSKIRQSHSQLMNIIYKIGIETDRDNANVGNNFSAKLLRIASESNK